MANGLSGIVPYLTINGRQGLTAATFYASAFGAEEQRRMLAQDGQRLMHCHMKINGEDLFLSDEFPEYAGGDMAPPSGVTIHL